MRTLNGIRLIHQLCVLILKFTWTSQSASSKRQGMFLRLRVQVWDASSHAVGQENAKCPRDPCEMSECSASAGKCPRNAEGTSNLSSETPIRAHGLTIARLIWRGIHKAREVREPSLRPVAISRCSQEGMLTEERPLRPQNPTTQCPRSLLLFRKKRKRRSIIFKLMILKSGSRKAVIGQAICIRTVARRRRHSIGRYNERTTAFVRPMAPRLASRRDIREPELRCQCQAECHKVHRSSRNSSREDRQIHPDAECTASTENAGVLAQAEANSVW